MAFYFCRSIDRLIPKTRRLLEKLEFASIDLENCYSGVGSRYDLKINESDPAHEQHGKQNAPESAAGEVKDKPQVDPAGNELRSRSVIRMRSDNLIIDLIAFINGQRMLPIAASRRSRIFTDEQQELTGSLSLKIPLARWHTRF